MVTVLLGDVWTDERGTQYQGGSTVTVAASLLPEMQAAGVVKDWWGPSDDDHKPKATHPAPA